MTLYPLYKFIFGEWLSHTNHKIDLIGASAGAWSMACAAQSKPLEAFEKYLKGYAEQKYPTAPTPSEISEKCKGIISNLLGTSGVEEILKADRFNLNIITSPSLFTYHPKSLKRKLFVAAFWNLLSRKNLSKYFERNIFSTNNSELIHPDVIKTLQIILDSQNIKSALLASGAIPTVIDPISINNQIHWDGGITDYHLDLKYAIDDGLVLYPHFNKHITPGWLDKYLKLRKANPSNHDRTVLIYPSDSFINLLPTKKIPTRDDFATYFQKDDERIKLWYKIIAACQALTDDFIQLVNKPILSKHILDFD